MSPSRVGGIPIEVKSVIPFRNATRRKREPSTGPCRQIAGAGKYTSRTMSETWATWRHQSPAAPSVYGVLLTRRNGRAPRAASVCR